MAVMSWREINVLISAVDKHNFVAACRDSFTANNITGFIAATIWVVFEHTGDSFSTVAAGNFKISATTQVFAVLDDSPSPLTNTNSPPPAARASPPTSLPPPSFGSSSNTPVTPSPPSPPRNSRSPPPPIRSSSDNNPSTSSSSPTSSSGVSIRMVDGIAIGGLAALVIISLLFIFLQEGEEKGFVFLLGWELNRRKREGGE